MRLLLVSNDQTFADAFRSTLQRHHYSVDSATSHQKGSFWARTTEYDLVIIDHNAALNAAIICAALRANDKVMPVLALVNKLTSGEAVALYNAGVDDYAHRDSAQTELVARVRALLRRPAEYIPEVYNIDDLTLDASSYKVSRGKKSIYLTKKEFSLLEYLLRHQDRVLSRSDLIEHVWDVNADLFSNSLETHILNLRRKIETPRRPKLIHTISGRGYKIAAQP